MAARATARAAIFFKIKHTVISHKQNCHFDRAKRRFAEAPEEKPQTGQSEWRNLCYHRSIAPITKKFRANLHAEFFSILFFTSDFEGS